MTDDSSDVRLAQAWDNFCDSLKAVKEVVLRDAAPAAAKEAVRGLTKAAANEWGQYGINVNAIIPMAAPTCLDNNRRTNGNNY